MQESTRVSCSPDRFISRPLLGNIPGRAFKVPGTIIRVRGPFRSISAVETFTTTLWSDRTSNDAQLSAALALMHLLRAIAERVRYMVSVSVTDTCAIFFFFIISTQNSIFSPAWKFPFEKITVHEIRNSTIVSFRWESISAKFYHRFLENLLGVDTRNNYVSLKERPITKVNTKNSTRLVNILVSPVSSYWAII